MIDIFVLYGQELTYSIFPIFEDVNERTDFEKLDTRIILTVGVERR